MRAVDRNSTKISDLLAKYQNAKGEWSDLNRRDRISLRNTLREEFAALCAYCEGTTHRDQSDPGPIDHFRPRNPSMFTQEQLFGADFTFDPLNIMHCCVHCQKAKGNKWPGTLPTYKESLLDGELRENAKKAGWEFVPVRPEIGYVCPNGDQPIPAENFFRYCKNGRIVPNESLGCEERSRALRTIRDFGLNDSDLMERRGNYLKKIKKDLKRQGGIRRPSIGGLMKDEHQHPNYVTQNSPEGGVQFTRYILSAFDEQWI